MLERIEHLRHMPGWRGVRKQFDKLNWDSDLRKALRRLQTMITVLLATVIAAYGVWYGLLLKNLGQSTLGPEGPSIGTNLIHTSALWSWQ